MSQLTVLLATPDLPPPVQARVHQLLRDQRRRTPELIDQTLTEQPAPWVHLSHELLTVVVDWMRTPTWHESHAYLREHPELLDADTDAALDELALTGSPEVVEEHRRLLTAARSDGPEAAYRAHLLGEDLRAWIQTSTWQESRRFLDDHPHLIADDVPEILAAGVGAGAGAGQQPSPQVRVHLALLTLIRSDGPDPAYGYLADRPRLDAGVHAALAERSGPRLWACAVLEEPRRVRDCLETDTHRSGRLDSYRPRVGGRQLTTTPRKRG